MPFECVRSIHVSVTQSHDPIQIAPASFERILLRVGVQLHRQSSILLADRRCNDGSGNSAEMHEGGAGMSRCVELDVANVSRTHGVTPATGASQLRMAGLRPFEITYSDVEITCSDGPPGAAKGQPFRRLPRLRLSQHSYEPFWQMCFLRNIFQRWTGRRQCSSKTVRAVERCCAQMPESTVTCQAFRGTRAARSGCKPGDPEALGLAERFDDYLDRAFPPDRYRPPRPPRRGHLSQRRQSPHRRPRARPRPHRHGRRTANPADPNSPPSTG